MDEYGFNIDTPEGDSYEWLDFDQRDEVDTLRADRFRETVFNLPARPGTRR